jgi:REP element-mobilizing transposase RayT
LTGPIAGLLLDTIRSVCRDREYLLLGAAVLPEHVHLLVGLRPEMSVSGFVRDVKGVSTVTLRPSLASAGLWAAGYFADSVGWKTPAQILAYIGKQSVRHQGPPGLSGRGSRTAPNGRVQPGGV